MSKKRKMLLWISPITLCCAVLLGITVWSAYRIGKPQTLETRTLALSGETVAVEQTVSKSRLQKLELTRRTYTRPESQITMGRLCAARACEQRQVEAYSLRCSEATLYWYDAETGAWQISPMQEQTVSSRCIYIESDTADYFIYTPIGYSQLANNALLPNGSQGYLAVEKKSGGWSLKLFSSQLKTGEVSDYTVVCSERDTPLLDTQNEPVMNLWKSYAQYSDGRWCFDGYYFPSADSYVPSEGLYRCTAAYGVRSMVYQASGTACAEDLSIAMLDTMALQQTAEGYFPTQSQSTWLLEDYGIDAGFYDTRFNSDLMMIFLKWMQYGGGFEAPVNRYLDFYLDYAAQNHSETTGGGWLVWDYPSPDGRAVHCSLNHQLAEMQVLYQYASQLNRPELAELADRMLLAIEDTQPQWIKADGNLHYAHCADGSFGMNDYPYLTYNDLYDMQQTLTLRTGARNAALDRLMETKLAWMQANGITGYHQ